MRNCVLNRVHVTIPQEIRKSLDVLVDNLARCKAVVGGIMVGGYGL